MVFPIVGEEAAASGGEEFGRWDPVNRWIIPILWAWAKVLAITWPYYTFKYFLSDTFYYLTL